MYEPLDTATNSVVQICGGSPKNRSMVKGFHQKMKLFTGGPAIPSPRAPQSILGVAPTQRLTPSTSAYTPAPPTE